MANKKDTSTGNKSNVQPDIFKYLPQSTPEVSAAATEREKFRCCSCGGRFTSQEQNFSVVRVGTYAGNNYRIPMCRSCAGNLFQHYVDAYGGDKFKALYRMCQQWNAYYNEPLAQEAIDEAKHESVWELYLDKVRRKCKNKSFDTTIYEEDALPKEEAISMIGDALEEARRVWGYGVDSAEDYQWLDYSYASWVSRTVVDSVSREKNVRQLCMLELQMNKSLARGDIATYEKLNQTFLKVQSSANLQPKQSDAADKDGEKPLGVMFKLIEDEDPIPDPLEEWNTYGIAYMFTVYFIGHLMAMLGLKNRYADMYHAEMEKYRVDIPDLEESDDEDVFDYIMNNNVLPNTDDDDE